TASTLDAQRAWVLSHIPSGVEVTFSLYSDDGGGPASGEPNTLLQSKAYTPPENNAGYYWHGVEFDTSGLSDDTYYWLVIEPTVATDTISVASHAEVTRINSR